MDPTSNLQEQIRLAREVYAHADADAEYPADAERLAELVLALNEWLERGGFLPEQWKREEA